MDKYENENSHNEELHVAGKISRWLIGSETNSLHSYSSQMKIKIAEQLQISSGTNTAKHTSDITKPRVTFLLSI